MRPDRKPHPRSWIKNLPLNAAEAETLGQSPECTQEAVYAMLRAPGATLDSTAARCLSDFAEFGCAQSQHGLMTSLSEWRPYYETKLANAKLYNRATAQAESEAAQKTTPEEREALILRNYMALVADTEDTEEFLAVMDRCIKSRDSVAAVSFGKKKLQQKDAEIAQKTRALDHSERRVALLEDNAAKAKAALETVKKTGGLTAETLRQIEEAARLL